MDCFKKVKKPKVHGFTDKNKKKRFDRAMPLYDLIKDGKYKKIITSDEAWFCLPGQAKQTDFQYILKSQNRSVCETVKKISHSKKLMVWVAFSVDRVFTPIFVKSEAKINKEYYIKDVLEPFLLEAKDYMIEGDYVFQQDSAPSHTAKKTRKFLKDEKIKWITPEQWMPYSPDVAPCDFWLWGYLKGRINKLNIKALSQLKKAIIRECSLIPQKYAKRQWHQCQKGLD
uniref:DDE_3 domain-containing protein n=1 Tax=Rhabditophanes sp. KR3021 TaxID=114890 RepID=A0AC35UAF6_9BILA